MKRNYPCSLSPNIFYIIHMFAVVRNFPNFAVEK